METLALFVLAWLLAQLEIQIEGASGWAESLPTWRWSRPWFLALTNGKPATGYHACLIAFIVGCFHLPLLFVAPTRAVEARILSDFLLMAVVWDFQWFVWNRHWGLRRFLVEPVWWFRRRFAGLPVDYYVGILASALATALLDPPGLARWGRVGLGLAAATAVSIPVASVWRG